MKLNNDRLLFLLIPLIVLFVVLVAVIPVSQSGYSSVSEALLRTLHQRLLWIAVPLAILAEGLLFYAAIRFHGNDDPKPTPENRRLEVTVTIAVAIVLLFVGASSYLVLTSPMVSSMPGSSTDDMGTGSETVDVHIIGQNWFWTFAYPGENVTTTETPVLPANRTIRFTITSKDVMHSVHIPSLGVKMDAIPGRSNTFRTRITETGSYRLYCAEYCGAGHSNMRTTVKVVSPEEYRRWLQQQNHTEQTRSDSATTNS